MATADAAGETAMLKRMVDVIARVIATGIVADPLIIGVDVRGIGVAISVGISRGFLLRCALRFLWCSVLLRPGRRRAMSGDVAVADVASLRRAPVLIASALLFLR